MRYSLTKDRCKATLSHWARPCTQVCNLAVSALCHHRDYLLVKPRDTSYLSSEAFLFATLQSPATGVTRYPFQALPGRVFGLSSL